MDWKNILERAAWTFVEGFLVALPAASLLELDRTSLLAGLAAAAMAGISAVKTMALELVQKHNAAAPKE